MVNDIQRKETGNILKFLRDMNGLELNNVVLGLVYVNRWDRQIHITCGVIHVNTHAINTHTCIGTYIRMYIGT